MASDRQSGWGYQLSAKPTSWGMSLRDAIYLVAGAIKFSFTVYVSHGRLLRGIDTFVKGEGPRKVVKLTVELSYIGRM